MAMPAGNGTGPLGLGPITGRAAGYCAGFPGPGSMNPVSGRGFVGGAVPGAYGPAAYGRGMVPYGYGAVYPAAWGRGFGRLGRGLGWFGRGFGRGRGRRFGRGFGRGWWW
jgi:hypothetical protein